MLTRIFGEINSSTTFFVVLLALFASVGLFFSQEMEPFVLHTAWGALSLSPVVGYSLFVFGLGVVLLGFQQLLEVGYKLLKRHAYLPFFLLFYILMLYPNGQLNMLWLMAFFMLILRSWLSVFHGEKVLGRTLNTGLLIGLASLIDAKMSLLLVVSFVVFLLFGRLNLRTFFILIIGMLTVWMNAISIEFIAIDQTTVVQYFGAVFTANTADGLTQISPVIWVVLGLPIIPALVEFSNTLSRANVFKRQTMSVLIIVAGFAAISIILFGLEIFQWAIYVPAVLILFVNFFQYLKKQWQKEALLWFVIILFVVVNLGLI